MNYFDSTNDSSHHALNVVVTREKQNSILVEATAEKKYENTLRPHGIQNKLAKSDKVVQDYPPEAKKSKKSKSTDPEEQKGQNIPFKEPYEDDHENMVLEGDKVCIAGSDVASENKNMVLEGDKLCIAGADVANDNENMVLEGGKVYIAGGDVASIALDSETVPVDSCKVLQASEYISAQPVIDPIWRGSFNTGTVGYELYDGLVAHLSSKAGPKVWEETKLLSESLCLDLVPKESVWPRSFQKSAPSDENIALYFFALDKRCIKDFDGLVSEMRSRELALRAVVTNAQLLVFTSDELPRPYWNLKGKFYLWGIFVKKKQVDSSVRNGEENITNNTALDSMSPVCSLSNIISSRMRWTLPESGELKLNVNASFNPETRESAVGGLIRDKDGKWVHGFYMYLRNFNPETAQFCALSRGLEIARKLKIPKLVLESNSEKAIEAVTSACPNHPSYRYIKHIRGSMDKDLICRIKMINRVANMCAIRLALEAFGSLTTNELPEPPEFMLNYLASDLQMGHDGNSCDAA